MNRIDFPDNTESLHNIGNFIMQYEPLQNAFLNALVNRIARVIVTSKMWNNPLAPFKKGMIDMGETVEEIFVNIAKPFSFDPEGSETKLFKRTLPDVRAAFHTMNYQKYYPVTVSNDQLRQAFLAFSGVTDLISRIVDTMYTAANYDEYVVMKYMLCREILNGGLYVQTVAEPNTQANREALVAALRKGSSDFTFLKDKYNRARVMNSTERDRQYVFIDTQLEADVDVSVLAKAFNMDKTEFLGHMMVIDSFADHDTQRLSELFGDDAGYTPFTSAEIALLQKVSAAVTDIDWWMVFDNYQNMTEQYNGLGLYWNYFLHQWKTFSVSPYANAQVFTWNASTITSVTVSPSSASVASGNQLQLSATVAGTGLFDKTVAWSISGQVASGTHIDANSGVLVVSKDEPTASSLTIKATAVNGTSGTATITVS